MQDDERNGLREQARQIEKRLDLLADDTKEGLAGIRSEVAHIRDNPMARCLAQGATTNELGRRLALMEADVKDLNTFKDRTGVWLVLGGFLAQAAVALFLRILG